MELMRREMISPEKRDTTAAGMSAESSKTMQGSHILINGVSGVSGSMSSTAIAMPESSSDARRTEIKRCFFMPSPVYLVADTAHSLDDRARIAELLTQCTHMHVDRPRASLKGVAPYAVEYCVAAQHRALIFEQQR